jgi:surface antigen
MSMMFTGAKPKTSKIGARFSSHLNTASSRLPARMGGGPGDGGNFIEQKAALPTGNSYQSAPQSQQQMDQVKAPEAGPDVYSATGTAGIARYGQAATREVQNQVSVKREAEAKARNDSILGQMNSAGQAVGAGISDISQNAWQNANSGMAVSPKMGANGSATWINSNNNKYHDFDGAFGAQCVDLYNFYMTGFVGGRSSVGMVSYAYQLWDSHDRGALVQIAKNQKPQMGDIAIWSNAMNGMGGHVAIVAQDNGNGSIRVLNANVAENGGSRGTSVMSNISTGTLMGYLRPRKLM